MHENTELSLQPDLLGCSSHLSTLPHFSSQNTTPMKIYLDFQKPKPRQRYCSPFTHLETKQKCANENSRDTSCLGSILADTSFTPPTTAHWRAWRCFLSYSLCASASNLESKKGDIELFTLKTWKYKALPFFFFLIKLLMKMWGLYLLKIQITNKLSINHVYCQSCMNHFYPEWAGCLQFVRSLSFCRHN